jgi:hypothetical protein
VADKLDKAFMFQREFMDMLVEHDRLPEYPVDLSTKNGQRLIKEYVWNAVAELAEASQTLRNRNHVIKDVPELDFAHYLEELGDAFAFFMEICILSNISPETLYDEYLRKNKIVRQKMLDSIPQEAERE